MAPATNEVRSVSFIVPAWNEESVLGPTLDAIQAAARQLPVPCEIIVVDDHSTDRTSTVALGRGARVIRVQHRQIAATRNAGARVAQGDLLFFVDADTRVTTATVRAAVECVRQGAVGGGCAFRFDGRIPYYAKVLEAIMLRLSPRIRVAGGCFLFCTRTAFDQVHGFNAQLYAAEEVAISLALRRLGRFVILRESVTTSGRKLRTHSAREIFAPLFRIAFAGRRHLRDRRGLEIWYGNRRPDHG